MNELRYGRGELGDPLVAGRREWRVTNGIGGFAAGTASGEFTRHRHGMLIAALAAADHPTLLLSKLSATLEIADRSWGLDTSRWSSGALDPAGYLHLESFRLEDGIPLWVWAVRGARLEQRIWMEQGENSTYVQYRLRSSPEPARLRVLALVNHRPADRGSGRGRWTARVEPVTGGLRIEAFDGATPLWLLAPGAEIHPRHDWFRDFRLEREPLAGGVGEDHLLAAELMLRLKPGEEFTLVASTRRDAGAGEVGPLALVSALARRRAHERGLLEAWRHVQPAVARHASAWIRALVVGADGFLAEHPAGAPDARLGLAPGTGTSGESVRDTLVALPGLTLATGRPERAREILDRLADAVDQAVTPDAPATAAPPDVALWYVQAVRAYFEHTIDTAFLARTFPRLETVLEAMVRGTRGGVSSDPSDGLLRAGDADIDTTWMDSALRRAGLDPRRGKAVEVNALWYNAHTAMAAFARRLRRHVERWEARATRIETGFARFWNPAEQCLFDVLDGPFGTDASVRPNQLFALSLPDSPLSATYRRAVLARCKRDLLTSHGVRGLSCEDPRYLGTEAGASGAGAGGAARAAALGSAWTWLLPNLALAHARVLGDRQGAFELIEPLESLGHDCGLGLMPDRSDGDPPHTPRGGLEGAWPVAETLRVYHMLAGVRRDLRRREMTRAREADTAEAQR